MTHVAITVAADKELCPGSQRPPNRADFTRDLWGYALSRCRACDGWEQVDEYGAMGEHMAYRAQRVAA